MNYEAVKREKEMFRREQEMMRMKMMMKMKDKVASIYMSEEYLEKRDRYFYLLDQEERRKQKIRDVL